MWHTEAEARKAYDLDARRGALIPNTPSTDVEAVQIALACLSLYGSVCVYMGIERTNKKFNAVWRFGSVRKRCLADSAEVAALLFTEASV